MMICSIIHTQAVLYGDGLLRSEQDFLSIIRGTELDAHLSHLRQLHKRHHLKPATVLLKETQVKRFDEQDKIHS